MSKLNAPRLPNKLPAFYGNEFLITFDLDPTVGPKDFTDLVVIVKNTYNNQQIDIKKVSNLVYNKNINKYEVLVIVECESGEYYKVQLACKRGNEIGYYSNASIIKCTKEPEIFIQNLDDDTRCPAKCVGIYKNEDISEKVINYEFYLYDRNMQLVESSGLLNHNSVVDQSATESSDEWVIKNVLEEQELYYIEYKVITVNGLIDYSPKYPVFQYSYANSIQLDEYFDLKATNEYENYKNGRIEVEAKVLKNFDNNGLFVLARTCSKDDFKKAIYLAELNFSNYKVGEIVKLYQDYTIEHGCEYKYSLRLRSSTGLESRALEANNGVPVYADFEDMFLYDGEKQLRLRFNPKVSSFKETVLEQKTDTMGSKYPFIFRNGEVGYKEFQISALISMLEDEHRTFQGALVQTDDKVLPANISSQSLTSENFYNERNFKLEVLDWLNNGKVKLFRSPAEGNYIVRLMNISLSPNDTLGRMLHTFNTTAYQVANFDEETLKQQKILNNVSVLQDNLVKFILEKKQLSYIDDPNADCDIPDATKAYVEGEIGSKIVYALKDIPGYQSITIGPTGVYYFMEEILKNNPLIYIGCNDNMYNMPQIIYGYSKSVSTDDSYFGDTLNKRSRFSIVQMSGTYRDIIVGTPKENLLNGKNIKDIVKMKIKAKDLRIAYKINDKYYDEQKQELVPNFNTTIYQIRENEEKKTVGYLLAEGEQILANNETSIKNAHVIVLKFGNKTRIYNLLGDMINDTSINRGRIENFETEELKGLTSISAGPAVIVEMVYLEEYNQNAPTQASEEAVAENEL